MKEAVNQSSTGIRFSETQYCEHGSIYSTVFVRDLGAPNIAINLTGIVIFKRSVTLALQLEPK